MKIGAVMFFTTDSMQPAALGRELEIGDSNCCGCRSTPISHRPAKPRIRRVAR